MDIEDFLILSPLIKGLHKYSHDICELFWDVKMEIYIFEINPKSLATKPQVNLQNSYYN